MKIWSILLTALTIASAAAAQSTRNLRVLIDDIPPSEGYTWVLVFDESADFLHADANARIRQAVEPGQTRATVDLTGLQTDAWYAIAVFQDRNGNGSLDRANGGRPAEPYAYSELGRYLGTPTFSEAAFKLRPELHALLLEMRPAGARYRSDRTAARR